MLMSVIVTTKMNTFGTVAEVRKLESTNYCVYKHTSPSGKVYIGITGREPSKRFQNGSGYVGNEYFSHAIKKYGWDNFSHDILADHLAKAEAEKMERELIAKYNSADREYGYNIDLGGSCAGRRSEETRQKISEHHADLSGENNPLYGKQHSEETRSKIKEALATKHPWRGKKQTEEAKRKISQANKGKLRSDEFREAVSERMRGNQVWLGKAHTEEAKEKMRGKRECMTGANHFRAKKVMQISKSGELIAAYDCASEAERQFTYTKYPSNISACCRGKLKTAYGYIWRYADEDEYIRFLRCEVS